MSSSSLIEIISSKSGTYLVFKSEAYIANCLRAHGIYQFELIKTACELIEKRGNGGLLVDIGAHIGSFSIPVAFNTECSVIAFEAQRRVSHLLGANYELNNIPNAEIHHVALSGPEAPSEIEIPCVDYSQSGNFGAFSIRPDVRQQGVASKLPFINETEKVEVRTLDSYALENVALIKVDVEGEELEVFKGAIDTIIMNKRPPLLFECWQHEGFEEKRKETIDFVTSLGYKCIFSEDEVIAIPPQLNFG
ncbi:FkbM family methyltransferase [Curvivirga aplysinae]|uniref:FkbM family methyltransferase n=1 Tax=Curvivirga aplysinae TaxID=2529852 RepID=UPI0012BD5E51|nr:FkbM family methyltransferase [Curvivirga aplysinae]MTI08501.1 FkbM family methyltransferase [Curvivirga aplysinae]